MPDPRRALPSVNSLLDREAVRALLETAPRQVVTDAVRTAIETARQAPENAPADDAAWVAAVRAEVERAQRPSLRPVLNGTGVVLHTNLGRAPLADAALDAIRTVAAGYSTLEYDLEHGKRGSRYVHCAALLRELTGAEDALVVNNNAAAVVLALNSLAEGREVVVSRGELVEIGGSFRIPDIMAKSGARLAEVGTTNRTHLDDYGDALRADTAAIVKVHRGNFAMEGFVAEVSARDLASLARARGVPLIHDLGSGLLLSLEAHGLSGEPTAAEAIRAGADVLTMSGDKLLGGPQAGIILGTRDAVAAIARNPLTRSYRVDKLTLAALEATLALYREPETAMRAIPVLAQLTCPVSLLRSRAERVRAALRSPASAVEIIESTANVGGGAFPAARIPSLALELSGDAALLERRLRAGDPPVVARVADGRVLIDLRTILPREDAALIRALGPVVS